MNFSKFEDISKPVIVKRWEKMSENIYCIWLVTWADHHVINDYVDVFSKLGISKVNVINSKDEHYWMFIVRCDAGKFGKLREWAVSKLGSSVLTLAIFQIDSTHRYFNRGLGQPLYAHPEG